MSTPSLNLDDERDRQAARDRISDQRGRVMTIEIIKRGHIRTTVTTQAEADERIPALIATPAEFLEVRIVPRESVDIHRFLFDIHPHREHWPHEKRGDIHLITAAGETGVEARPSHPDWFRSIRDECRAAGVKFVFEGWGEWDPVPLERGIWHDFMDSNGKIGQCMINGMGIWKQTMTGPNPVTIQRVGVKKAGRMLDGMEWK